MRVYSVIKNPEAFPKNVDQVIHERIRWVGYKTNGGMLAILHKLDDNRYGFVYPGNRPVFVERSRQDALEKAIDAGRDVRASDQLSQLMRSLYFDT